MTGGARIAPPVTRFLPFAPRLPFSPAPRRTPGLPTVLRGGGRAQRGGRPGAVIVVVHGVSAGRRRDGLVLPTSLAGRSCS